MKEHKQEKERYRTGEKALTFEQVQALLSLTDLPLLEEGLLRLGLNGGLRRTDIVGVRAEDLHEEDGSLTFYEHKKRHNHSVFLSPATVKVLNQVRRQYPSVWLFPTSNPKNHISSKTAYNILQRHLVKIGVPTPWPFHSLRSTCVKLCQKAGWTVEMAAKHIDDSVRVVQEHYATPSQEEMKAAMREKAIL
jgi:integrase